MNNSTNLFMNYSGIFKATLMAGIQKVLILDDDQDDRDLLSHIYESYTQHDISLEMMKTAEELFKYLQNYPAPDIIILDQNMPRLSGLEIIQIIQEKANLKNTKIIMFSTVADPFFTSRAIELGATAVYEKPIYFDKMIEVFLDILYFNLKEHKV